ncbi:hypothetical protein H9P43_009531 [Blastocladiella emersonii ATCC 22665]|nr:hypothetical protein H9P43_009531 [Blastocladiella emersonii ATCC 22665]
MLPSSLPRGSDLERHHEGSTGNLLDVTTDHTGDTDPGNRTQSPEPPSSPLTISSFAPSFPLGAVPAPPPATVFPAAAIQHPSLPRPRFFSGGAQPSASATPSAAFGPAAAFGPTPTRDPTGSAANLLDIGLPRGGHGRGRGRSEDTSATSATTDDETSSDDDTSHDDSESSSAIPRRDRDRPRPNNFRGNSAGALVWGSNPANAAPPSASTNSGSWRFAVPPARSDTAVPVQPLLIDTSPTPTPAGIAQHGRSVTQLEATLAVHPATANPPQAHSRRGTKSSSHSGGGGGRHVRAHSLGTPFRAPVPPGARSAATPVLASAATASGSVMTPAAPAATEDLITPLWPVSMSGPRPSTPNHADDPPPDYHHATVVPAAAASPFAFAAAKVSMPQVDGSAPAPATAAVGTKSNSSLRDNTGGDATHGSSSRARDRPPGRETPREYVDRLQLQVARTEWGEMLACPGSFFAEARAYFVQRFDFRGVAIDLAFRKFVFETSLPRETQANARIVECFGTHYEAQNPDLFPAGAELPERIAYVLLMNNTFMYNPKAKKDKNRPSREKWIRDCANDYKLPIEMFAVFYDNNQAAELVLCVDTDGLVQGEVRGEDVHRRKLFKTAASREMYRMVRDGAKSSIRELLDHPYLHPDAFQCIQPADVHTTPPHGGNLATIVVGYKPRKLLRRASTRGTEVQEMSTGTLSGSGAPTPSGRRVPVGLVKRGPVRRLEERGRRVTDGEEWYLVLTHCQVLCWRGRAAAWTSTFAWNDPKAEAPAPTLIISTRDAVAVVDHSVSVPNTFRIVANVPQVRDRPVHGVSDVAAAPAVAGTPPNVEYIFQSHSEGEVWDWVTKFNYAAALRTAGAIPRNVSGAAGSPTSTVPTPAASPTKQQRPGSAPATGSESRASTDGAWYLGALPATNHHHHHGRRSRQGSATTQSGATSASASHASKRPASAGTTTANKTPGASSVTLESHHAPLIGDPSSGDDAPGSGHRMLLERKRRDLHTQLANVRSTQASLSMTYRQLASLAPLQRAMRQRIVGMCSGLAQRLRALAVETAMATAYIAAIDYALVLAENGGAEPAAVVTLVRPVHRQIPADAPESSGGGVAMPSTPLRAGSASVQSPKLGWSPMSPAEKAALHAPVVQLLAVDDVSDVEESALGVLPTSMHGRPPSPALTEVAAVGGTAHPLPDDAPIAESAPMVADRINSLVMGVLGDAPGVVTSPGKTVAGSSDKLGSEDERATSSSAAAGLVIKAVRLTHPGHQLLP